ncbi:Acyltransferase family protein [uncultured archaeon]|nr:Acyltransferase family protein [uncultured archaeon]
MLPVQFTDEMKAFAILLIFLAHSHLSETIPFLSYGNYGNAIFLFLSGYGLYASGGLRPVAWAGFLSKRARRVLAPAAVFVSLITLVWLLSPELAASLHGFRVIALGFWMFMRQTLLQTHLWFIAYIFFWYLAYAAASRLPAAPAAKILLLFGLGFAFTMAAAVFSELYLWAMFAFCFPSGLLLGHLSLRLGPLMQKRLPGLAACILLLFLSLSINRDEAAEYFLFGMRFAVPFFLFTSVFFGAGLLGISSTLFSISPWRPLLPLEGVSYEYYLVHLHAIGLAWLMFADPVIGTLLAAALACLSALGLQRAALALFPKKSGA